MHITGRQTLVIIEITRIKKWNICPIVFNLSFPCRNRISRNLHRLRSAWQHCSLRKATYINRTGCCSRRPPTKFASHSLSLHGIRLLYATTLIDMSNRMDISIVVIVLIQVVLTYHLLTVIWFNTMPRFIKSWQNWTLMMDIRPCIHLNRIV